MRRAFTLIEVIVVIAAISLLTSAGYYTVTSVRETARENKLETDVANLNSAVQMYTASGGDLSSAGSEDAVLAQLKTRADADGVAKQVGMKGSFIDARTVGVMQSTAEAGTGQSRAVWNATKQRFEVVSTGGAGVKEFQLDSTLAGEAVETEARARTLVAANVESSDPVWVWDYTDTTPIVSTEGGVPGAGPSSGPGTPTGSDLLTLDRPTFSVGGGARTLDDLKGLEGVNGSGAFTETLQNPNTGIASTISPSSKVTIVASSTGFVVSGYYVQSHEPDVWQDSPPADPQTYSVVAYEPELTISSSGQSFTPYELGVPIAGGGDPVAQATVTATITTWDTIPEVFTPPPLLLQLGTGTATLSGGTQVKETTLTLSTGSGWDFSSGSPSLVVNAAVDSQNEILFASDSATASFTASKVTLAASITPASNTTLNVEDSIVISGVGTLPAGYVITYTTTGASTPGGSATGEPATFSAVRGGTLTVNATISGPAQYANWFVSGTATATYTINPPFIIAETPGVLVSGGNIANNALIQGAVILALNRDGSVPSLILNNNATIVGNIYAPGTPTVTGNVGAVVDLGGSATPDDYTISVENGATVGTVYRRINPVPQMPDPIDAPTGLTDRGSASVGGKKSVTLDEGHYTSVIAGNNSKITLGDASSTEPLVYHFDSLSVGTGVEINVAGPVVVYMNAPVSVKNSVIFGNSANPEWLQIKVIENTSGGGNVFEVENGGALYAQVLAPDSTVKFSQGSTFTGGVTAGYLDLQETGSGFVLSLTPPTE